MMRPTLLLLLATILGTASASIFLPGTSPARSLVDLGRSSSAPDVTEIAFHRRRNIQRAVQKRGPIRDNNNLAMAIPGTGLAETVIIGGFGNFISIYNTVITGRILLSWFPQAQGIALLQPVFAITDPYLNLFRGIIPPIFGLDLSPILAFVTLDLLGKSAVSLAAEDVGVGSEKKGVFGVAMKRGQQMQKATTLADV